MLAWGEIAYECFREHLGVTTEWEDVKPEVQAAWDVAAYGVRMSCANLITVEGGEPVNEEANSLEQDHGE